MPSRWTGRKTDGMEIEARMASYRPAAVEHHLAAREQIGRHGGKRNRHLLDLHVGNQLLHGLHHPVALDQALGS